MSNGDLTPAQREFSRVFLIEGRARGDHTPEYMGCMRAGPIDWSLGAVTKIDCPSSQQYGKFVERGKSKADADRPTTSLVGLFAADLESTLIRLAKTGCAVDLHYHFGQCTDPQLFDVFQQAIVWEDVDLTNYSADDLGALDGSETGKVNETSELSAREFYQVLPLAFAEVAATVVTNEVIDVVVCDSISCGECIGQSGGCERVYAVTLAAGGSPGTPADVVYTLDGGANWNTSEIDSLGATEDPTGLACLAGYMVVVSADSCSLHYVLQADLDAVGGETWVQNVTGFVDKGTGTCPLDIWSVGNYAFISAEGGYVYGTADPTAGVVILEAGNAVTNALWAIHAMNRNVCVAVGSAGAVIRTLNGGDTWQHMSAPVGIGTSLQSVWVKTETEWWVGSSDGRLFETLDGGNTWNLRADWAGGVVYDIAFSSDNVMTVAHTTAAGVGRLLRSYNGGNSFVVLPEGVGALPASTRLNAIALCENDVNVVAAVGLDGGADGIILWGED